MDTAPGEAQHKPVAKALPGEVFEAIAALTAAASCPAV